MICANVSSGYVVPDKIFSNVGDKTLVSVNLAQGVTIENIGYSGNGKVDSIPETFVNSNKWFTVNSLKNGHVDIRFNLSNGQFIILPVDIGAKEYSVTIEVPADVMVYNITIKRK